MYTTNMTVSFQHHINGDLPVVVDFFAKWYAPCIAMLPVLSNVKHVVGDTATILKLDVDKKTISAIREIYGDSTYSPNQEDADTKVFINLPKEYISLATEPKGFNPEYKHAIHYLTERGITQKDIIKYNIGYCVEGLYARRVIVPSYNSDGSLNYFIARGHDIFLGDPDVAPATNPEISAAIRATVDGTGAEAGATLAEYGIKYLFLKSPVPEPLVRTIDGLGGYVRNSATSAGITWRVVGNSDRLIFFGADKRVKSIPTNDISADFKLTQPGKLRLAENNDRNWKVIGNGKYLERKTNSNDLPTFEIKEAGNYLLIHDGTIRRALLSLQIIFLISALVMAAPAGRRKRDQEMP